MLDEPLHLVVVEDPDPEAVTRRRRLINAEFDVDSGPSQYERDFYARVGRPCPSD